METSLVVAGYQMEVGDEVHENSLKIHAAIDLASDQGAEILLTPEGALSGYTHHFNQCQVEKELNGICLHARQKLIGLALGTCFIENNDLAYNQLRFYRPDGTYLGFHSKILRTGPLSGPLRGEITRYSTSDLRIFPWRQNLVFGGLICNDMWANPECTPVPDPHLSQKLVDLGANVILHSVNGGRDGSSWSEITWNYHEANLCMRARAGNVWIVTVDNAAPIHLPCSAPSGIINPTGAFIKKTSKQGEELFLGEINIGFCKRV